MYRRGLASRALGLPVFGFMVATLLHACETVVVSTVEISEIEVVPPEITLLEGRSETASAVVRESGGGEIPGLSVTWTVDDPEIARVTSEGVVEALRPGTTRVRAWSEGVSGAAELLVVSDGSGGGSDDDDDEDDEDDEEEDDDDEDGGPGRGRGRGGRGG